MHAHQRPAPLVFVDDLGAPELDASDRHHLERVLRIRRGDELTVSDGSGGWRVCAMGPQLEPRSDAVVDPAPAPTLAVGFALVKGGRPEWIVQKLTEAGVDVICPFFAARSVVRWDEPKREANVARWRRVAREASMQCRRVHLPRVEPVCDFAAIAARQGAVLADMSGEPLTLDTPTVLVGPEGGWSPEERAGRAAVVLGSSVLRAETAAVAAGILLGALRAGVVSPASLDGREARE